MTSKRRRRRIRGKFRKLRRSFKTLELTPEQVEAIARSRMDPRHDHLNRLLND
jgi:hypothetical protein